MNWLDPPDPSSEVDGNSTGVTKAFKSSFKSAVVPILVRGSSGMDSAMVRYRLFSTVICWEDWDDILHINYIYVK